MLKDKEQEIVVRAQRDPVLFAPLYDHYFTKIYSYVFHRVHNTQLAEDLVAETFYKALANIDKFKWQERSFACWLYTIARNQVVDYYRKQEPFLLDDVAVNELVAPAKEDPEAKVLQNCTHEELLAAIHTLSSDQQDALLLRFREGLRLKEIAQILGKNEGAVKSLLFRGLKSLRRRLELEGGK
ncbi:MAG: sigma-70 family RNA polymerase sigma factor [Bacillota bacterium]